MQNISDIVFSMNTQEKLDQLDLCSSIDLNTIDIQKSPYDQRKSSSKKKKKRAAKQKVLESLTKISERRNEESSKFGVDGFMVIDDLSLTLSQSFENAKRSSYHSQPKPNRKVRKKPCKKLAHSRPKQATFKASKQSYYKLKKRRKLMKSHLKKQIEIYS